MPADKVVRLHGTEWSETQQFHRSLDAHWRRCSPAIRDVAAPAFQSPWTRIGHRPGGNQWHTRELGRSLEQQIGPTVPALGLPGSPTEWFAHGSVDC
ncbi:helicase IV, partial [Salmonella enterica subsp. enterica serovar Typhimurium]